MKKFALAIAVTVLFSSIPVWGAGNLPNNNRIISDGVNYILHSPIRINSNADFNAAHGVTAGNGTQGNPYIIENYEINFGTGTGYCIYIGNTTHYFIIQDCHLYNARGYYNPPYYIESVIQLYYVNNGTIRDCNFSFPWITPDYDRYGWTGPLPMDT